MKRVILFIATNLAIMLVLGVVARLFGVDRFLTANGLDMSALLGFAAVMGFGGSFASLLMSKTIAKWSTGARVIEQPKTPQETWLVEMVGSLTRSAGLAMPEVAIYEGGPNAFATGPSRSNSLVAVSTGLLSSMNKDEVKAVLAHEVSHIQNGDMVTLTLIQGVVNTFVFFLARVVGYAVDSMMRRNEDEEGGLHGGVGLGYHLTVIVCEIVFGILASALVMYFSRVREFRADRGAAHLMGSANPMIDALRRLGGIEAGALPQNMTALGIAGAGKVLSLFASHPSIEERISALRSTNVEGTV